MHAELAKYLQQLKTEALESIKQDFSEKWLKRFATEIDTRVDELYGSKLHELALNYQYDSSTSSRFQPFKADPLQPAPKTITIAGVTVLEKDASTIHGRVNRETIQEQIQAEFLSQFEKIFSQQIQPLITQRLESLPYETWLSDLQSRHPWILKELFYSINLLNLHGECINNFIHKYVVDITNSIPPKMFTHSGLGQQSISWNELNPEADIDYIDKFPETRNARSIYRTRFLALPDSEPYSHTSSSHTPAKFYRLDLYRFICNWLHHKNNDLGELPSYVFAYDLRELALIGQQRIKPLTLLFVNLGTEEETQWILLKREGANHWNAYLPKDAGWERQSCFADLNKLVGTVHTHLVDCNQNAGIEVMEDTDFQFAWHTVLLGRVFPWLVGSLKLGLKEYRSTIPLHILYASVIGSCSREGYESPIDFSLIWARPFSNESWRASSKEREPRLLQNSSKITREFQKALAIRSLPDLWHNTIAVKPLKDGGYQLSGTSSCNWNFETLVRALYIIYHHQITHFSFREPSFLSSEETQKPMLLDLFDRDMSLLTLMGKPIMSTYGIEVRAWHCAARNRFLHARLDDVRIKHIKSDVESRTQLWDETTAYELIQLFSEKGKLINQDFYERWRKLQNSWPDFFTNQDNKPSNPHEQLLWEFGQIALMGKQGINVFFAKLKAGYVNFWQERYKLPWLNLSVVFDLNGDGIDTPENYTENLYQNLNSLFNNARMKRCSPIFENFSLILPKTVSKELNITLWNFFKLLHTQYLVLPEEVSSICLYVDDLMMIEPLLKHLKTEAESQNLAVLIELPFFDRAAELSPDLLRLKALYREIQNKIQENQRQLREKILKENTKSLQSCLEGSLDPEVLIKTKEECLSVLNFEGDNDVYPLQAQTPGIQQQLQQTIERQHQQEQEDQVEEEVEEEFESNIQIESFLSDEGMLITRDNIDDLCTEQWQAIPAATKAKSGLDHSQLLRDLFSLWVGSDRDAAYVIKKIEPKAVEKLMHFAPHFRMGLAKDNLPAGFYLAYSKKDKGLVLCFDEKRRCDDLARMNSLPLNKRNPFKVFLHQPQTAISFVGDYRQMATFNSSDPVKVTLWHFLAKQSSDKTRIEKAKAYLASVNLFFVSDEEIAVMIAQYTLNRFLNPYPPQAITTAKNALRDWIRRHTQNTAFLDCFLEQLTEDNFKAWGQLFNHYDRSGTNPGTLRFIQLAEKMYSVFGETHFSIWKRRLLDPSLNWSELLDKKQIDAMALSLVTLENKPAIYQQIWWMLVDAHGEAVGAMQYDQLWYGYQTLIQFMEKNELVWNREALENYLDNHTQFNAAVFMNRLYAVLKKPIRGLDKARFYQDIFNQIERVDWSHNGAYYAIIYEQFPYWHDSAALNAFNSTQSESDPAYTIKLDRSNLPEQLGIAALRFAIQRMDLSYEDVLNFDLLLKKQQMALALNDYRHMRLLLIALSMGIDTVSEVDDNLEAISSMFSKLDTLSEDLEFIIEVVKLDDPLLPYKWRLKLKHSEIFLNALNKANFDLRKKSNPLAWINACGRVLECLELSGTERLEEHLTQCLRKAQDYLTEHSEEEIATVLNTFPWVVTENEANWMDLVKPNSDRDGKKEIDFFYEQMQSVDYKESTYFPGKNKLFEAILGLIKSYSPHESRKNIIRDFVNKGCVIRIVDTRYRKLNEKEQAYLVQKANALLKNRFKQENLILITRFAENFLGVQAQDRDIEKTINQLIKVLASIDNKAHYNELGQVLGALIQIAKNPPQKLYSIEQITYWLSLIENTETNKERHFCIDILKQIVNFESESVRDSQLINSNWDNLSDSFLSNRGLSDKITEIIRSEVPNQFKARLVRLVQKNNSYVNSLADFLILELKQHKTNQSHYSEALVQWVEKLANSHLTEQSSYHQQFRIQLNSHQDPELNEFLQKMAITFMTEECGSHVLNPTDWYQDYQSESSVLIRAIVYQCMHEGRHDSDWTVTNLIAQLKRKNISFLQQLAKYIASPPIPSPGYLTRVLHKYDDVDELIDNFERVHQGLDVNGNQLRHYSITDEELQDINRVVLGIKNKGSESISDVEKLTLISTLYYLQNFSQVAQLDQLKSNDLVALLDRSVDYLQTHPLDPQASADVLACMRELLLRKTGKWINHTQMMDLIYAAMHNSDSLLHQVKMGQGKSIIAIIRAGYLALTGKVVDLYSAKESLSSRDHEKWHSVLDAMGIVNAYITPGSKPSDYKTSGRNLTGAVNYATIGNWSLFLSSHLWKASAEGIRLTRGHRIALLDECDHILGVENTQFNFSDSRGAENIYNFNGWVYSIAYTYYLEINGKCQLPRNEAGIPFIERKTHLKELAERLQQAANHAPKQSDFVAKYLSLLNSSDPQEQTKRDSQLKQLLVAAHLAHGLKEGVHFCVKSEYQKVDEGMMIPTRFAKVMIGNQVMEGSTYSELVHQLLHARLNHEAIHKGEPPNFFIEPDSEIALSQNAKYLLSKYYDKLEGCSGTAGDTYDIHFYQTTYNIQRVVKMPEHESSNSKYLGIIFAENEEEQHKAIANELRYMTDRPSLITCEDDIAVKRFGRHYQQSLPPHSKLRVILDTNDQDITENELVLKIGESGWQTFSARMGRGTDIEPKSEPGLFVLRTYPAIPKVVKQELGRQGRNGRRGTCKEIINYGDILKSFESFKGSDATRERIKTLLEEQKNHLNLKLKKHETKNSSKWGWIKTEDQKDKYVITRAVVQLRHELKKGQETYLRHKEALIAVCSGHVMDFLYAKKLEGQNLDQFQELWMNCRSQIEEAWKTRLTNQLCESEETYKDFATRAYAIWMQFAQPYLNLGLESHWPEEVKTIKQEAEQPASRTESQLWLANSKIRENQSQSREGFTDFIAFYQHWVGGVDRHHFDRSNHQVLTPEQLSEVYFDRDKAKPSARYAASLSAFYNLLRMISTGKDREKSQKFFVKLRLLPQSYPGVYALPVWSLTNVLEQIRDKNLDLEAELTQLDWLQEYCNQPAFSHFTPQSWTETDFRKAGLLCEAITQINLQYSNNTEPSITKHFIQSLVSAVKNFHWDDQLEPALSCLRSLSNDPKIAQLLVRIPNEQDWIYYFQLIKKTLTTDDALKTVHQQRIKDLRAYINKYHDLLMQERYSPILRSFLEMVFNPHLKMRINELPAPDCLNFIKDLPEHGPSQFWALVARADNTTNASVTELLKLFKSVASDQTEVYERYLQPLFGLGSSLLLSDLVQTLQGQLSSNSSGLTVTMNQLKRAQKAHDRFMESRAGQETRILPMVEKVSRLPIKQQLALWKVLNNAGQIPAEILSKMTENHCARALNNPGSFAANLQEVCQVIHGRALDLPSMLSLVDAVESLPEETMTAAWNAIAECKELPLTCIIKVLEYQKNNEAGAVSQIPSRLRSLSKLSRHSDLTPSLEFWTKPEVLNNTQVLSQFIDQMIANNLSADFTGMSTVWDHKPTEVRELHQLMRVIGRLERMNQEDGFDAHQKTALIGAWARGVLTANSLDESIDVVREAYTNLCKNDNSAIYFKAFHQNRQKRTKIMQLLHHDILTLPNSVKEGCFRHYRKMAATLHKRWRWNAYDSARKRQNELEGTLHSMVFLTRELSQITTLPSSQTNSDTHGRNFSTYRNVFNNYSKDYKNSWFVSKQRRRLASHLFFNMDSMLNQVHNDDNELAWALFDELLNAQKIIILNDGRAKNKIGRSRLFDLTQDLLIKIAQDILNDTKLNPKNAVILREKLNLQLVCFLGTLSSHLDIDHPLRKLLERNDLTKLVNNPGSKDYSELAEKLADPASIRSIPSGLKYLLPSIRGLLMTTETEQMNRVEQGIAL